MYLPKHSSWLNQIEIVFGIVSRPVIRRGNFKSLQDLKDRLLDFVTYFNNTTSWIVGVVDDETLAGVGSIQRSIGSSGEVQSESRYGVTTT